MHPGALHSSLSPDPLPTRALPSRLPAYLPTAATSIRRALEIFDRRAGSPARSPARPYNAPDAPRGRNSPPRTFRPGEREIYIRAARAGMLSRIRSIDDPRTRGNDVRGQDTLTRVAGY